VIARPDRFAIASALRETGLLLGLEKANRFRARSFARAADVLEHLSEDLDSLVAENRLTELRGIGPGLAAVIAELHADGRSRLLDRLRAEMPAASVELSRIPGLTARRLGVLKSALGIESLADLQAAAREGRIRNVKGFGERTEQKLLQAIERYQDGASTMLVAHALEAAERFLRWLRALEGCVAAEVTGSVRRFAEIVSNVDLVAAFDTPRDACARIARYPPAVRVEVETPRYCALRLADGLRARVTIASAGRFVKAWHETTGSPAHLSRLAKLGAARPDGEAPRPATETEVYARLGLPWIPPELREDAGEIEAALAGDAFEDLVSERDVRGIVHCHTEYSDGKASVEAMARAAEAMGMSYITITDHSPAASYAGGLRPEALRRQWDEIDRVQQKVGIRLLRGTESDILQDGSLDYPDAILRDLDVVIASIHVRHKMDAAEMTRRVIAAMRHPVFKIWGHPLGRLLKRREPFACDVEAILDAVAASRAAIEINGDPNRLDLEPRWVRLARSRGIPFVISTDAHATSQLRYLRYGVALARRGGVRRREVLNALDADAFARAVRPADARRA
jgi:DNA polymerase (family 10)